MTDWDQVDGRNPAERWNDIATEQSNPRTKHIDQVDTLEMVRMINAEDQLVAQAVAGEIPQIARAVDLIHTQMAKGGRLIYVGSGTSGRLGILDAVECPPTYGTDPSQVVGLIAGGYGAIVVAVEGAEDNRAMGQEDLQGIDFSKNDALVGIAASGRTPYVLGAMDYARSLGAPVIAVTSSPGAELTRHADISIQPNTGPEVVTGSTRMKSGTAQKMILNMLSTCVMIKLGKVYGNLMVDVRATNEKLVRRAVSIVRTATGVDEAQAKAALAACGQSCKQAIVSILLDCSPEEAEARLREADGRISQAVPDADRREDA